MEDRCHTPKCQTSLQPMHEISIYFYQNTCYGGAGLKSADCRPANWRPTTTGGSPAKGSPTSMPRVVVSEPEPTPQCQKLPLSMRKSPGAK